jgi:two-component system, cell cycle sensor histidine kinase and response regulator CckA
VEARAIPVPNPSDNTVRVLSVIRDITEQHELEQQLQQAREMDAIGQLAGGVAHDFNNILSGVMGLVDLSLMSMQGQTADDLKEIKRLCQRGADLTRQLLAFSRRSVTNPVILSMNDVILEARKLLRRLIGEHIELETSLDPQLEPIRADRGQMEQIIVNLAVNARDAMPDGGRLSILTRQIDVREETKRRRLTAQVDKYVMLVVRDTGHGMTDDVAARIFEPFFTTKEVGRGTGLGLATAYGIIKQSHGDVWVFSQPGLGTTFEVYLPCVATGFATEAQPVNHTPIATGTETILVAEDDEALRSIAGRALRASGFKVLEAMDGTDALKISARWPEQIDLLVTDVVMPKMGGSDLANHLREVRPKLKVLFVSGYATDSFFSTHRPDANNGFVEKPFSPETLTRTVREILDRR